MIENHNSPSALQAAWQEVIRMRERMDHLVISTFAADPNPSPVFGNILYNLPLRLAMDVLKQVLRWAKEEGQVTGSGPQYGDLLDSAKISLPWIDWQYFREGVERGNEVALQGELFGDRQCLEGIASIEAQLRIWGVIAAAEPSGAH